MGGAVVGVADDAAAWFQNPAGLALSHIPCQAGKTWSDQLMGIWGRVPDFGGTDTAWAGNFAAYNASKHWGFGAGYGQITNNGKEYGAGFGAVINKNSLAAGLDVARIDPDDDDAVTVWNAGAMYLLPRADKAPVRLGLRANDLTKEYDEGIQFDFGVAYPTDFGVLLAIDVLDITSQSENGHRFNFGGEYQLKSAPKWTVRAGLQDNGDNSDLTLGLGYKVGSWKLDAGWANTDPDKTWAAGASWDF